MDKCTGLMAAIIKDCGRKVRRAEKDCFIILNRELKKENSRIMFWSKFKDRNLLIATPLWSKILQKQELFIKNIYQMFL